MNYKKEYTKVNTLLKESYDHLNYCGYGDSWERECSRDLQEKLDDHFKEKK